MENIHLDTIFAHLKSILIHRAKPRVFIKIAARRLQIDEYTPSDISLFIAAKPAPEAGIIPVFPGFHYLFFDFC